MEDIDSKSILITGTSTGIGRACALYLDRLGFRVFAGVRREEDALSIKEEASQQLTTLLIDVTNRSMIEEAVSLIQNRVGEAGLYGLVNNAGYSVSGPFEIVSLDDVKQQFEVNLFGAIAITQACIPLLRRAKGRVVNIGSIAGIVPLPFLGPYSASKFALEAFNDALRLEVIKWGMEVVMINPGSIQTPIWDKSISIAKESRRSLNIEEERLYGKVLDKMMITAEKTAARGVHPDEVSKAVADALRSKRPKSRYIVGRDAKLQYLLSKVLPARSLDRLKMKVMNIV
jgi:NAD(P)-dependent dehydrogenase (short-subunit alcohol dehydrogenase family)